MLTLIPSRLFQTQLVEDPTGSSKESTSFSLSMFHQNFTELKFRKILFHLLLLFFSDIKIQDLKDSQRENVSKNVGCREGREIYKQPKNRTKFKTFALWRKYTPFNWPKKHFMKRPPLNSDNAWKETLLFHWFDIFPYLALLFITYVVNVRPVGIDVDIMITLILMCE